MLRIACLAFWVCSAAAWADWHVDPGASSLQFVTTKATQSGSTAVSEVQRFGTLDGSVESGGRVRFDVVLASVDTANPLRDARLRERLFDRFAHAEFRAQLAPAQLTAWPMGQTREFSLDGTLTFNGYTRPCRALLTVVALPGNVLWAVTRTPILIDARDYGLGDRIDALRALAGLAWLSPVVPLTLTVTLRDGLHAPASVQ